MDHRIFWNMFFPMFNELEVAAVAVEVRVGVDERYGRLEGVVEYAWVRVRSI